MKNSILLTVFFLVIAFVTDSSGQVVGLSVVPSGDTELSIVKFRAPADRNFLIFEASPRARSTAECFAATDFSSAVPVGPDRAAAIYDPGTGVWYLKNTNTAGPAESCKVLLVKSSVDTTDLTMFRARFGQSLLSGTEGKGSADRNMTSFHIEFDRVIDPSQ
jgi:hypothetical protein